MYITHITQHSLVTRPENCTSNGIYCRDIGFGSRSDQTRGCIGRKPPCEDHRKAKKKSLRKQEIINIIIIYCYHHHCHQYQCQYQNHQ